MLYMQQHKYTIKHIPVKEHAADALSRLPAIKTRKEADKEKEEYARTVVADAIPATLLPLQVERESEQDPTLKLVGEAITSGECSFSLAISI